MGLIAPEFKLIEEVGNYGGYFNYHDRLIAYNKEASNCLDITIVHEIGHYLQYITNNWYNININYSLSDIVYFERQAETIGYYLYNLIFGNCSIDNFNHYFKDKHVSFTYQYYKDWGCNIGDDRHEILYKKGVK